MKTNLCLGFSFQVFFSVLTVFPWFHPLPGDPTCGCLVGTCLGSGDLCPSLRIDPVTGGSMEPVSVVGICGELRGGCCDPFPVGCWLMMVDDVFFGSLGEIAWFQLLPTWDDYWKTAIRGRKDVPLWSSLLWEAGKTAGCIQTRQCNEDINMIIYIYI